MVLRLSISGALTSHQIHGETRTNFSTGGDLCGALDTRGRDFQFSSERCLEIQLAAAVAEMSDPANACGCANGNVPPVDNACGSGQLQIDFALSLNEGETTTFGITGSLGTDPVPPGQFVGVNNVVNGRRCVLQSDLVGQDFTFEWMSTRRVLNPPNSTVGE